MMMLRGNLSDSPVVDSRQKDGFLPPLNRKCTGANDCAPDDGPDEATAKNTQFLNTRWRANPTKGQNGLEVNQPSMSESFVLPRINGSSSQTSTEQHDRRTRTSLSLPPRTRDTCLPLSKSCPVIMGNPQWQISEEESPDCDGEYKSDNPCDFISVYCNADVMTNGMIRDGKHGGASNSQDDITNGVVRKLAKLESPRSQASQHSLLQHHHHRPHDQQPKTKEAETTLPDIFVPKGLCFRLAQNQPQKTTHGNIKLHRARQREEKQQGLVERTIEHERRVPGTTGLKSDNSYVLNPSPWPRSGTGEAVVAADAPPAVDQEGKRFHPSHHQSRKESKTKRKQKKQTSLEQDRPHRLRDTTQASNIKCMNWLAEGH